MEAEVLVEVHAGCRVVTLNRPKKLNSLNLGMVRRLRTVMREVAADPTAAAAGAAAPPPRTTNETDVAAHGSGRSFVLLKGAGGKAFCAGGDMRLVRDATLEAAAAAAAGGQRAPSEGLGDAFFREEYALNGAIAWGDHRACPLVALWDGVVMGGGVGLSIHGAFRVVTERAMLAMPEAALGFFPDVGASYVLSHGGGGGGGGGGWLGAAGSGLGAYVALSGVRLGAADLVYGGLATHFVRSSRLPALEQALLALAAAGAAADAAEGGGGGAAAAAAAAAAADGGGGRTVAAVLAAFAEPPPPPGDGAGAGAGAGFYRVAPLLAANRAAIDRCFCKPTVEAVVRALQQETGGAGGWAAGALELLRAGSPTSLKVTLAALRAARSLPLAECLAMDFRLSQAFTADATSDFFEGVRAILVDKDRKPRWLGGSGSWQLAPVSEATVARFLAGGVGAGAGDDAQAAVALPKARELLLLPAPAAPPRL